MTRKDCGKCAGRGQYKIGPQSHDWKRCSDCRGKGYVLELGKMTVTFPDGETMTGSLSMVSAECVELTDKEIAAIHLGRTRLANSGAIKQVADESNKRYYAPISAADRNAAMTCEAINVLDELLDPYGYKFGEKMGTELVK